jgi:CxC4 like cysteine cluster associated with KDZ transposases
MIIFYSFILKTNLIVSDTHIQNQLIQRVQNLTTYLSENFQCGHHGEIVIIPEACNSCTTPLTLRSVGRLMGGWLLLSSFYKVSVYSGECTTESCHYRGVTKNFDGHNKAIVNWNNKLFLGVEFVRKYMKYFAMTGLSVHAWWQTQLCEYFDNYKLESIEADYKELSNYSGVMSELIAGAAELMVFDERVFHCCHSPKVIQMDGIALSVRDRCMPEIQHPWLLAPQQPNASTTTSTTTFTVRSAPQHRHSFRQDRQFAKLNENTARIMREYLDGTLSSTWSYRLLHRTASNPNEYPLDIAVKIAWGFRQQNSPTTVQCPVRLVRFVECLLKDVAPVCTLVPYQYRLDVCNLFANPRSAATPLRRLVLKWSPIMYDLFLLGSSLQQGSSANVMWSDLCCLCNQILEQLEYMYRKREDQHSPTTPITSMTFEHDWIPPNVDLEELWATGCYFPGYPVVRKMQHINLTREPQSELCSKHANPGGTLAPGVVQFLCVEHKQCIGFVVLDAPESPRMVYEVLMTRFSENPCIVLYDNACNLLEYILNRDPYPLRNISFFVDGFHYASHKNCTQGFDTKQYPVLLKKYNTSLVEQKNAKIARFKHTNPSKKYRTMVAGLRFAIALMNIEQHQRNNRT